MSGLTLESRVTRLRVLVIGSVDAGKGHHEEMESEKLTGHPYVRNSLCGR